MALNPCYDAKDILNSKTKDKNIIYRWAIKHNNIPTAAHISQLFKWPIILFMYVHNVNINSG